MDNQTNIEEHELIRINIGELEAIKNKKKKQEGLHGYVYINSRDLIMTDTDLTQNGEISILTSAYSAISSYVKSKYYNLYYTYYYPFINVKWF